MTKVVERLPRVLNARLGASRMRRGISRSMQIGIFITVISIIQISANGSTSTILIGAYHFYIIDLAIGILTLALLLNVSKIELIRSASICALVFVGLYLFWLLRGISANAWDAFASFRVQAIFPMFCVTIIAVRSPLLYIDKYLPSFIFGALALSALLTARMFFGDDFLITNVRVERMLSLDSRPLDAYGALFLGNCSMLFAHIALSSRRSRAFVGYGALASLSLVAELLTRQRAATVATVAGFCVLLLVSSDLRQRIPLWLKATIASGALLMVVFFLLGEQATLSSLLPEAYQQSFTRVDTLDFRHQLWSAALAEFAGRGLVGILFGSYAGYQPSIIIANTLWATTLHNMYLQTLANIGILGLGVLILLVSLGCLSALHAVRHRQWVNGVGLAPGVALAWLAAMCIFGYAYEWIFGVSLFVALACVPGWRPAPLVN